MIYPAVTASVGNTPLVELARLAKGSKGRLLAKLEMRNPCGSVKDRLGLALIEDAEARGLVRPGATLIEATGGNTGIGLASAAAVKGYHLVLVMPEAMSEERAALLRHLGAEVRLTPGILMSAAVELASKLARELPGSYLIDQFNNPANVEVHRRTTAEEIWADTEGTVDTFVSAVGTGGTLMGVATALKPRKADLHLVAVEPAAAAVLSGGQPGQHRMPGIGVGFMPPLLNRAFVDEVIAVSDSEALRAVRSLARKEGISAGMSSGAALCAALSLLNRANHAEKTVVVLLPDTGDRYIGSGIFDAE
jgi:cysteine synthase A